MFFWYTSDCDFDYNEDEGAPCQVVITDDLFCACVYACIVPDSVCITSDMMDLLKISCVRMFCGRSMPSRPTAAFGQHASPSSSTRARPASDSEFFISNSFVPREPLPPFPLPGSPLEAKKSRMEDVKALHQVSLNKHLQQLSSNHCFTTVRSDRHQAASVCTALPRARLCTLTPQQTNRRHLSMT